MAVGTDAIIAAALLTHLSTLVFDPPMRIVPQGVDFPGTGADGKPKPTPPQYLRATFVPNTTTNSELGSGQEQHRGVLAVSIFWPNNDGFIDPLDVAARIISHFDKGTVLHADGLKIVIDRKPYASSPLQGETRLQVPITIQYHAFA